MMAQYRRYERYKDSGVEWIGEIPLGWDLEKIKYVTRCNIQTLGEGTDDDFCFQYIDISSVTSDGQINLGDEMAFEDAPSRARRVVRENDTIVSTVRTYLKAVAFIPEHTNNWIASTGFAVITPQRIYPKFLYYVLRNEGFISEVSANSFGVSYPAITSEQLIRLKIAYPVQINEQVEIANFLDQKTAEIDSLIADKEKLIALLEEQRQAIITETMTRGLNPDVRLKASGVEWIREIPQHWKTKKLKYVTHQIIDGTHSTPDYQYDGIPFLRVTDITGARDREIDLENVKFISEEEHKQLIRRCHPQKGDLLVSKNGTIGIPKVVDWDFEFSIFVSLCLLKLNRKVITPDFGRYFFESSLVDEQIAYGGKKSTITNLHLDKIKEFVVFLPPIDEQQEIVEYLRGKMEEFNDILQSVNRQIELLKEFRQSLIFEAVTGKIDVREVKLEDIATA
ncbi:restriction endonuclease subunit S [Alicyclobacillus acidiphilus]|uniref:restriction endonuclease subunit S n=1 Tax=Alicyclobacillus acidiphilus TaxID=182455 RepID=UPI00082BC4DB|nr:restriction endonuclease subunit S [Alicyclobacillus acidiphilus]